jgi:hypothetical protein
MTFLDTITRYMAERYVRFGDGEIWVGKQRVAFTFLPLIARELLINSALNKETYPAAVFLSGRRQGYEFIRQHAVPLVKSWTPIVALGMSWMNLFGAGTYRTIKADNKEGFVVLAGKSTLGLQVKAERPDAAEPVDFVIGGLVAGTLQYYTKTPTYGVEISCIAQKDVQECVFAVGNREKIMEYVQKFSPDKVDFAKTTLNRIEALEKRVVGSKNRSWLIR